MSATPGRIVLAPEEYRWQYRDAAKKRWFTGICAVLAGLAAMPADAAEQVDLELVIATDVSYSVDDMEARMQREGAVTAFRSPEVVEAIKAGSLGKIAVAYIDFSNANASRVVVDWQVVHDQATAEAFADAIAIARKTDGVQTSIASGIELAARMLEDNDYDGHEAGDRRFRRRSQQRGPARRSRPR